MIVCRLSEQTDTADALEKAYKPVEELMARIEHEIQTNQDVATSVHLMNCKKKLQVKSACSLTPVLTNSGLLSKSQI